MSKLEQLFYSPIDREYSYPAIFQPQVDFIRNSPIGATETDRRPGYKQSFRPYLKAGEIAGYLIVAKLSEDIAKRLETNQGFLYYASDYLSLVSSVMAITKIIQASGVFSRRRTPKV